MTNEERAIRTSFYDYWDLKRMWGDLEVELVQPWKKEAMILHFVKTTHEHVLSIHSTCELAQEAMTKYQQRHPSWVFEIYSRHILDEEWEG